MVSHLVFLEQSNQRKILDTPGAPQNLVVKSIKKDSVTLEWDVPLNDGGSKIRNYVIDKRESTRKAYANVSTKCLKTTFKVENLIEGALYYFRVMAENEYGIGQAVETKTASKASEVPLPVGKVFLTDVTKTSATLAWEKPEHDGGSRIDKWGVATNTKTCDGTVTGLTAGAEYQFRIIAYNEKGKSEPRVLAAPVIASDMTMEPNINMQFNTYTVLAGKDLKLEFPVLGRPKPKVNWMKNGQPFKVTSRVNILNTASTTGIQITEACKDDFGKYSITANNAVGTVTEDLTVVVLDKPGPPKGPVNVIEVSNTFVHLSWEPPEYTGGCQVKNYIVEKRDATTTVWQPVNTHLARTALKITKLKTSAEYQFRIIAENRYGKSVPLESKAIVVQYSYKPPGPPGTPFVKYATKEMMIVEWNEPVIDGGSAVIGYHLESKERNSILWNKLNKTLISDTQFKICNLEENIGYEFRVYAENIVGIGRCSKVSESYVARDPCDPPGAPEAVSISKNQIKIQWTKPQYDGGSKVNGYIVERKDISSPDGRWVRANFTNVVETEYIVTNLLPLNEYLFRVRAVNKYGVGDCLESEPVIARNPYKPPSCPGTPEANEITKDSMVVSWTAPEHTGGAEIQGYHLEKRSKDSVRWTKCNRQKLTDTHFKVTGLTTDHFYEFRVAAENEAGVGDLSELSLFYRACDATTPPGPPHHPKVTDYTKCSVSLSWNKPDSDGGAFIKGYINLSGRLTLLSLSTVQPIHLRLKSFLREEFSTSGSVLSMPMGKARWLKVKKLKCLRCLFHQTKLLLLM
uniref:Titin n=1 Tax=Oryzias sinensis TaxID=183150 RepID=A0A8C7ZVD9_9TELE